MPHDPGHPEINLLSPLTLRGITLRNRIVVSPMCQYSSQHGMPNDWHLVHLGSRAAGGAAVVFVEATAVTPDGRITPGDMGIWSDAHAQALAPIAGFVNSQGAIAGIQIAHAGRKASCAPPWLGGRQLAAREGGWVAVAPSPLSFHEADPAPRPLDREGIAAVVAGFEAAAVRAVSAGFRIVEIHAAHGYLLHEFLSPLTNRREDDYGGTLENRMRLLLQVAQRVRGVIPSELPLFVRISTTDWTDGGWDVEQSVQLAQRLKPLGVDLIDASSGGAVPNVRIPLGRGFQVPNARRIRAEAHIRTSAVGLITEPEHANEIIRNGDADLVFLAREMLREPYWSLKAEQALGGEPRWPIQYGYTFKRPTK
jgi:2,4-dienoyl-CoA reductase-like NADH-dependent reductase (Old Yellow Enzyme family)